MGKKKAEVMLLAAILIVILLYLFSLFFVTSTSSSRNIYQYLLLADKNPDQYMIVVGKNVREYELTFAEKLSSKFNIRVINENEVYARENLIMIGNSGTNNLLGNSLLEDFGSKAALALSGKNLLLIVNDEAQASGMYNLLSNYKIFKSRLKHTSTTFSFNNLLFWFVIFLVLLIPLIIFDLEYHRNIGDKYKEQAIKEYIQRYLKQGYSEEVLKKVLTKYGYSESIIDEAIRELENA